MIRTTIPANEIIHIKHTIEVYSCKQKRKTKGLKKKQTVKLTLPGSSSVHGIFQARILEWVAIYYYWGSY